MVRKRTSSYHKTRSRCFVARGSATKQTQRQLPGMGSSEQSRVSIAAPPTPSLTGCRVRRNSVPFHTREGGAPTEGEGLPQGHPARPPGLSQSPVAASRRRAFLEPEPHRLYPGKGLEQPGPGIF